MWSPISAISISAWQLKRKRIVAVAFGHGTIFGFQAIQKGFAVLFGESAGAAFLDQAAQLGDFHLSQLLAVLEQGQTIAQHLARAAVAEPLSTRPRTKASKCGPRA